ncbi:MAG TPA: DNA-deoxyinosine glycosylase [Gammaproteobacteria bacterium]
MSRARVPLSVGFPPIADARARVLVLGSLPGVKSLEMREYYAQPYNAFWRIMGELAGAGPALEYPARLVRLRAHGIAVWDVLAAGEREGSLDSAIVPASIVVNDFNAFFERHRQLRLICFNGNTAAGLFTRKVLPGLAPEWAAIERRALPSTSPAYASLRFEQKLARWREALGGLTTPI